VVRRDGKDEPREGIDEPCCASPAGASPAPVSVGAPGSRSPASGETRVAEARRREPLTGRQGRGPQHDVKLAAPTESQPGSRAAHFTAKATTASRRSETIGAGSRGVWSAARVQGEARNTGDPSARPSSGQRDSTRLTAKATAVQRKSEGIVVPVRTAPQNAVGGKGPWGGHDGGSREHKGMVATGEAGVPASSQPNSPGRRKSVDHVERLQRRLGAAAKRSDGRRFHALYDRISRRGSE
jgi:hypothetical protein